MGRNVKIGTGVKFVNPKFISIGDNVTIMDDVTVIARGGGVEVGNNCHICERVYLDTKSKDVCIQGILEMATSLEQVLWW